MTPGNKRPDRLDRRVYFTSFMMFQLVFVLFTIITSSFGPIKVLAALDLLTAAGFAIWFISGRLFK